MNKCDVLPSLTAVGRRSRFVLYSCLILFFTLSTVFCFTAYVPAISMLTRTNRRHRHFWERNIFIIQQATDYKWYKLQCHEYHFTCVLYSVCGLLSHHFVTSASSSCHICNSFITFDSFVSFCCRPIYSGI